MKRSGACGSTVKAWPQKAYRLYAFFADFDAFFADFVRFWFLTFVCAWRVSVGFDGQMVWLVLI